MSAAMREGRRVVSAMDARTAPQTRTHASREHQRTTGTVATHMVSQRTGVHSCMYGRRGYGMGGVVPVGTTQPRHCPCVVCMSFGGLHQRQMPRCRKGTHAGCIGERVAVISSLANPHQRERHGAGEAWQCYRHGDGRPQHEDPASSAPSSIWCGGACGRPRRICHAFKDSLRHSEGQRQSARRLLFAQHKS